MHTMSPRLPRKLGGGRIKLELTDRQYEKYRATGRVTAKTHVIRNAACGLGCHCDAIATPKVRK